jgi:hypothetical protein
VKNILRYLTKKPKSNANRELLSIAYELKNSTYVEFDEMLKKREEKYIDQINEKTYSET